MSHDVFISYSTPDKGVADAACERLESHGIRCWIAPRDVLPGTEWLAAIDKGLAESQIVVVVLSSNADKSKWVIREVERAVEQQARIVNGGFSATRSFYPQLPILPSVGFKWTF